MDLFNDDSKTTTIAAQPTNTDANSSASDIKPKVSSINRNSLIGNAFIPNPDCNNALGFRPHYLFLYGTLMDPTQLQKVLQLEGLPILQAASIIGWKVMLWGQYPALVFKPSNIIHGMAYEVQKESHMEYLKYYETEVYKLKGCKIKLADGRDVSGKTFMYHGDTDLLREGSFDLKDWQMEQLEKKS